MRQGRAAAADARRPRRGACALRRPAARGRALSRRLAAIGAAAAIAGGILAAWSAGWYAGNDFICLWHGARIAGGGGDPYDIGAWSASMESVRSEMGRAAGGACADRYSYPLWTALAMLPLAALPLPVAASAWMAISFAAAGGGALLVWRAAGGPRSLALAFATIVLASQPFWTFVITGQMSGLLLGIVGLGVWLLARGREGRGGAVLALLALKPQVAGVFVPAVIARRAVLRDVRSSIGAAAVLLVLIAASVVVRPTWPAEWASQILPRRAGIASLLPTAWGLAADLFGDPRWGAALIALATGLVVAIVRGRAIGGVTFAALALSLSLFATPHLWSYDMLVLALPWGAALALAASLAPLRRAVVLAATVIASALLPWTLYAVALSRGQETLSAVVPVAAAIVLAAAIALQPAGAPIA